MTLIAYVHATLATRWRDLRTESDRGDNPVPTAVIIVGLAILAVAVLTWAFDLTDSFMDDTVPGVPAAPTGG
jgi:hypothetical protein